MMLFEDYPNEGRCKLNLHDYTHDEAIELANKMVKAAYENGRTKINLIHGARDVYHRILVSYESRGSIKWALRGILYRGEWMEYAFSRNSKRHEIEPGQMTLALRPNPKPRKLPKWPPVPTPTYK